MGRGMFYTLYNFLALSHFFLLVCRLLILHLGLKCQGAEALQVFLHGGAPE